MTNLSSLNKFCLFVIFFILVSASGYTADPIDIWKSSEETNENEETIIDEQKQESLISVDSSQEEESIINEEQVETVDVKIIGLFNPEKHNLNLDIWVNSDGNEIKKVLERINNLKLSKFSEDLFFKILFTSAYPPKQNLTSDEFLNFKITWLIKNKKITQLEELLKQNAIVGKKTKAIRFLVEENLSSANIKSACEKARLIDRSVQNDYLEKFNIYCLIHEDRKDEAQLVYDLLKERGFNDAFFENKINFLLGYSNKPSQKILDNNLINFYLSQVTIQDFKYKPTENTDQYIWRYLSSANLLQTDDLEELDKEGTLAIYEIAAASDSFSKKEIFNIYKKFLFNINQYLNVNEVYKTLPKYKARALIYQSILISDNVERKLELIFLLKNLFDKDDLFNAYSEELSRLLETIDPEKIPASYVELRDKYIKTNLLIGKKIKFNNEIIHQSKVLKYFVEDDYKLDKVEKDLYSVYKKVKKNKKYFISIKDIITLESLKNDGVILPKGLEYKELASELTVPQGLYDLVVTNQTGLAILKIIEIIGEDKVEDLDPETIYFLNRILNELKLKKIRNDILFQALPVKV